ncbi:MAG: hypothetical protein R3D33_09105 [Hyphomicrobiaceae bacterium]
MPSSLPGVNVPEPRTNLIETPMSDGSPPADHREITVGGSIESIDLDLHPRAARKTHRHRHQCPKGGFADGRSTVRSSTDCRSSAS